MPPAEITRAETAERARLLGVGSYEVQPDNARDRRARWYGSGPGRAATCLANRGIRHCRTALIALLMACRSS